MAEAGIKIDLECEQGYAGLGDTCWPAPLPLFLPKSGIFICPAESME